MVTYCDGNIMRTEYLDHLPEDWLPAARVFSALGDATRQKILLLFEPGEALSIKEISSAFSLGRSTVVHHLSVLEEAGILSVRRQGRQALYTIVYNTILASLERLRLYIESDLNILSGNTAI
jgi:DNA-binding transcriptional ArsR family regulator